MMHLTAFKYVYFNKLFNCYLYMVLVLHSTTKQYKQKGIQQKCIASQKLWESVNNPDYLFTFKSKLCCCVFEMVTICSTGIHLPRRLQCLHLFSIFYAQSRECMSVFRPCLIEKAFFLLFRFASFLYLSNINMN